MTIGRLLRWFCWLAPLCLSACGDGGTSAFADFFGDGTTPGSSYDERQPGAVTGRIVVSSKRAVIVLDPAESVPANHVAVPLATAELVEVRRSAVTGVDGVYRIDDVSPASYTLRITLPESAGGASSDFHVRVAPGATVAGLPTGD